jgi:ankyrin repeat protein
VAKISVMMPTLEGILAEYAEHIEFTRSPPTNANAIGTDNSVLHVAVFKGDANHVRVLLAHGARVNVRGDMGYTPLHDAVCRKNETISRLLLAAGADTFIQNEFGKTALDEAEAGGAKHIAKLIKEARQMPSSSR